MKRTLTLLLAIIFTFASLTACGRQKVDSINAADIKAVTASTAVYSSYLYGIEDEGAVAELVELYNSIQYDPEPVSSEVLSEIMTDTLYMLSFSSRSFSDDTAEDDVVSCWLSPKGYVVFDNAVGHKLLSEFEEERLKELLEKHNIF